LGELLDSLLDISRLDVAGIKPQTCGFPLQTVFERLDRAFRRAAANSQLTLRFRPTSHWFDSDPVMVERMIANLIANALRYTPGGGRILIAARRRGDAVRVEVRDSGIGIAPEHQAMIFGEFYQVGNRAREPDKGLGLGLSIVDRLARLLDIKVSLRSRPGAGTTFILHIPCYRQKGRELPLLLPQSAGMVYLFGSSEDLTACHKLLASWNYSISSGHGQCQPPDGAIIITEAGRLAEVMHCRPTAPVITIGFASRELPPGIHALRTPPPPAKLRALVAQLQKTLLRSMP
jgi:anti-sigma regulatory factor (Ser/Thr protein kinase)